MDLLLSGHKHVPNVWKIKNNIVANAGSLCSRKLRGKIGNSFNVYNITDDEIEIYLNNIGGEKFLFGKYKRNVI